MKNLKKLKNEDGFTMVEGMIGGAMLAIVIGGAVKLASVQSQLGKTSTAAASFGIMSQKISSMVPSVAACETLLGAKLATPPVFTTTGAAATDVRLYQVNPALPAGAPIPFLKKGDVYEGWKLTSIQIVPTPPFTQAIIAANAAAGKFVFPAKLVLHATPPVNTNLNTAGKDTAEINLAIRVNAALKIQSCSSVTFASDQNPVVDCSINPIPAPGCIKGLANNLCDATLFKQTSDGIKTRCTQIKCKAPYKIDTAVPLLPTGDVHCK